MIIEVLEQTPDGQLVLNAPKGTPISPEIAAAQQRLTAEIGSIRDALKYGQINGDIFYSSTGGIGRDANALVFGDDLLTGAQALTGEQALANLQAYAAANDGHQQHTAWAAPGEGVLVYDPAGGPVTQADQVDFTLWILQLSPMGKRPVKMRQLRGL